MKRGLISWDKNELSEEALKQRIANVQQLLLQRDLSAMVIYSELWRSNQARFFSNYMPYFNRALLVVPQQGKPVLLCALSPRVYQWIQSVTIIEDIRPVKSFVKAFGDLVSEKSWSKLGVLDSEQFPFDINKEIHSIGCELVDIDSAALSSIATDRTELAIRKKAVALAKSILKPELEVGSGQIDHHFVGRLEGALRGAGAEDLILLISHGDGPPALPEGKTLGEHFSISIALEYRGHWIRITRPFTSIEIEEEIQNTYQHFLANPQNMTSEKCLLENLGGSYPWEVINTENLKPDSLFAMHLGTPVEGKTLYYGETCLLNQEGIDIL